MTNKHQSSGLSGLRRAVGALAAAFAIGACASASAAEPAPDLKVYGNTTTIELAPVLLAAGTLYPGKASVTNGGVPDLFKPGGADIATNAETQALRVSVDNPDLRIIFTVSEGLYRIVARRSAGISRLRDLKGKRIATFPNTSSAYYLDRMLRTVGLTDADVTVVPLLPLSRMSAALKNGEVDAVTIWEPEMQLAQEAIGEDAIEFQDRSVYRELFNLNTTRQALADPVMRRKIVTFVRSLIDASEQIRRDPRIGAPLVARASGYDETLVGRVMHHQSYPGTLMADLLDVLEAEEAWVARERNRTPRTRAQLATLIDDSVLREALAAR